MTKIFLLSVCVSLLWLTACGNGPGVAPEPGSSPSVYHGGDLPQGTANDTYRGR